jgi:hypothetical protein
MGDDRIDSVHEFAPKKESEPLCEAMRCLRDVRRMISSLPADLRWLEVEQKRF